GAALVGLTLLGVTSLAVPGADVSGIFLPYWPMFALGIALYYLIERGCSSPLWSASWTIRCSAVGSCLALVVLLTMLVLAPEMDPLVFAVAFAFVLLLAQPLDPWLGRLLNSDRRLLQAIA